MRRSERYFLELLGAFRVTLAVFIAVVAGAYVQRAVVVTWLASMDAFQDVRDTPRLPARFWLVIAVRLAIFAAAAPLAAEGWIFVCRLRNAPLQARLWPAFCLATTLALAGAFGLTWHFADALRHSLVYLSDARAPSARPAHWNASGGVDVNDRGAGLRG